MQASLERPTRVRYWVIFFAVTLSVITYIDRVCISVVTPFIKHDLNLDSKQMGWCLGAFALAYSLFENAGRFPGRSHGPAPRTDAHRCVVVVLHRRHGLRF